MSFLPDLFFAAFGKSSKASDNQPLYVYQMSEKITASKTGIPEKSVILEIV